MVIMLKTSFGRSVVEKIPEAKREIRPYRRREDDVVLLQQNQDPILRFPWPKNNWIRGSTA
jgi:hypothetical protein